MLKTLGSKVGLLKALEGDGERVYLALKFLINISVLSLPFFNSPSSHSLSRIFPFL